MLLKVENLTKKVNISNGITILDKISFGLKKGDFACIMGKSGSGKTTLLNAISGMSKPTSGKIFIDNTDIYSLNDEKISYFRNKKIGYIMQENSLLQNFTSIENICIPFMLYSSDNKTDKAICIKKAENYLKEFELEYIKDKFAHQLSGGEARRVAILRSLICEPMLIIADEPTNDLDEESLYATMNFLKKVNEKGTTLLLVTHDKDASAFASTKFKMSFGKLEKV